VGQAFLPVEEPALVKTNRIVSIILGSLVGIAGLFFMVAYAIPSSDDLSNPNLSRGMAILGIEISWAIPLGALIMAYRFLRPAKKLK
jgi:TRAP-type C4-dicarboxylate transport system permease small subunit